MEGLATVFKNATFYKDSYYFLISGCETLGSSILHERLWRYDWRDAE